MILVRFAYSGVRGLTASERGMRSQAEDAGPWVLPWSLHETSHAGASAADPRPLGLGETPALWDWESVCVALSHHV